jgi:hypothetical protein
MRHIEDLNFELNVCLDRAKKTKDESLVNSLLFCLLTIDELEQCLELTAKVDMYLARNVTAVEPKLISYIADYINEEQSRNCLVDINECMIINAIEAFEGGAGREVRQ